MDDLQNVILTEIQLQKINELLDYGLFADAIKLFREYSGVSLRIAKEFIDVYDKNRDFMKTQNILLNDENVDFNEAEESFGDFLRRKTPSQKELNEERKRIDEDRHQRMLEGQVDLVCEDIRKKAFSLAKQGISELNGVLRHSVSMTDCFISYAGDEMLQSIKANDENDYKTKFYNYDDANQVKRLLEKRLSAMKIAYDVKVESQYYYYYTFNLKSGFFTSKTVREKKWGGDPNKYVVIFAISW